jgi:hypothetical protein
VTDGEDCDTTPDDLYPSNVGRIGEGKVDCGYMPSRDAFEVSFWGNSNLATQTVNITYSPEWSWYPCKMAPNATFTINIKYYGEATFDLKCQHDEFYNATCTAEPFEISITSWEIQECAIC